MLLHSVWVSTTIMLLLLARQVDRASMGLSSSGTILDLRARHVIDGKSDDDPRSLPWGTLDCHPTTEQPGTLAHLLETKCLSVRVCQVEASAPILDLEPEAVLHANNFQTNHLASAVAARIR